MFNEAINVRRVNVVTTDGSPSGDDVARYAVGHGYVEVGGTFDVFMKELGLSKVCTSGFYTENDMFEAFPELNEDKRQHCVELINFITFQRQDQRGRAV